MKTYLSVNRIKCRTQLIEGFWYVIIDGEPHKLYQREIKAKSFHRKTRRLLLKAICESCGEVFFGKLVLKRKYCSRSCTARSNVKNMNDKFIKSHVYKELKIKANLYINKLIKDKKLVRPNYCSYCETYCKPQFHHPDYGKFYEGMWLCTSHHKKVHFGHNIKGKLIDVRKKN